MILQDAARRGTGLARLIGLAWALTGQRRAGNADARRRRRNPHRRCRPSPRPRQAARWSRDIAPSSRPGNTPRWRPRSAPSSATPGRDRGRRVQEGPAAGAIRLQPATGPAEQGPCRPERRRQDLARQPAPGAAQFGGQGRTGDLAGGSAEGRRRGGREQGAAGQVPRDRPTRAAWPSRRSANSSTRSRASRCWTSSTIRRWNWSSWCRRAGWSGSSRARRSRCASTTGKTYPAKVQWLAARVDPVSQSIKVNAGIDGHFDDLIAGMSGQVLMEPPPVR